MGGDNEEESSRSSSSSSSSPCSYCFSDGFGLNNGVSEENLATDLRRREKSYQEIIQSYDLLQKKTKHELKLARNLILSYTPGSWSDVDLRDYDVPKITSILIVGPKGAGKSSLVNKITRVIADDEFAPARAQESYGTTPSREGTFFVHEYMIPRGSSSSFCLFDTRGLSQISSSDNTSKIEQWITRGVYHGEPVIWSSDSSDLKERLIRDDGSYCEIRKVNSVIFVCNAVEILKSMESETSYAHMVSTAFNCPLLSFKDDKPAVVMTHGDLLLLEERARVRVYLGELLGIPPDKQIFDIPESHDTATALTVCNLLRHSLEHADKNLHFLPKRNATVPKLQVERGLTKKRSLRSLLSFIVLILLPLCMIIAAIYSVPSSVSRQNVAHHNQNKVHIDRSRPWSYNLTHKGWTNRWRPPRDSRFYRRGPVPNRDPVPEGDLSIDFHTKKGLRFDEQKVVVAEAEAEAEPSFDWRTRRRLWYAE